MKIFSFKALIISAIIVYVIIKMQPFGWIPFVPGSLVMLYMIVYLCLWFIATFLKGFGTFFKLIGRLF